MKYTASKFSVGGYSDAYSKGWDAVFGKPAAKKKAAPKKAKKGTSNAGR